MAFIGLEIPEDISKILSEIPVPGTKSNSGTYHLTLVHFELNSKDIKSLISYIAPIFELTSLLQPFEVSLTTLDTFPSEAEIPIIVLAKSKSLQEFWQKLTKSLDQKGLEFSKKFKTHRPHVTLSFCSPEQAPKKSIDLDPVLKWQVQNIVLWGGKQGKQTIKISFPLAFEVSGLEKTAQFSQISYHLTQLC